MNHDVIHDRYGRLFELPHRLGKLRQVFCFCLDYQTIKTEQAPAGLGNQWRRASVPGSFFIGWLFILASFVRHVKPGCIIASSDCIHVILGSWLAASIRVPFYADLYDDYTAFGLARLPGIKWLYRRALAGSAGISAVSVTLAEDLRKRFPNTPVIVLESTIDEANFSPKNRSASRASLGLDHLKGKKLIGVCGGLNTEHGVDVVFQAFEKLAEVDSEVVLVVAGKLTPENPLPTGAPIEYLGMLAHSSMATFYAAMDVVIVALANSPFGYYAFPQKAYEVVACKVPVAAADIGALGRLFETVPQALYLPDRHESLANVLNNLLENPVILDTSIPSWDQQAARLNDFLS